MRLDGRRPDELRPLSFARDYTEMADGAVLVTLGRTRVLCTASVSDDVPRWMRGRGTGWVTAEYSMLPGSSPERVDREARRGRQTGRTQEIQRLVGRSLRAVCDMARLGERSVTVDCDVLQADGGTRVASICGGYIALHDALSRAGLPGAHPLTDACAAVSVAVVDGRAVLDPDYREDVGADVDMNVVMTGAGDLIEVQGTAEGVPFGTPDVGRVAGPRRRRDRGDRPPPARVVARPAGRTPRDVSELPTFVAATANPNKLIEMRTALEGVAILLERPAELGEVPEDGDTLEANARIKAVAVAAFAGAPALADDTGLEVDALDGAPGVHSARYAGAGAGDEANVVKLLAALTGVAPPQRTARFRTVVVARWPDGRQIVADGVVEGSIADSPRGERGFGYDPVFVPAPRELTFAEMSLEAKSSISHRGRALRALALRLAERP